MAATITYVVTNGAYPVTVSISPAVAPDNVHNGEGEYSFEGIPVGDYVLTFTDNHGCTYEMTVCDLMAEITSVVYSCVFDFTLDLVLSIPSTTPSATLSATPSVTPSETPTVTPSISRTPTITP